MNDFLIEIALVSKVYGLDHWKLSLDMNEISREKCKYKECRDQNKL